MINSAFCTADAITVFDEFNTLTVLVQYFCNSVTQISTPNTFISLCCLQILMSKSLSQYRELCFSDNVHTQNPQAKTVTRCQHGHFTVLVSVFPSCNQNYVPVTQVSDVSSALMDIINLPQSNAITVSSILLQGGLKN